MAYSVFLDGLLLPVPPGKMQTKIKNLNKTVSLIGEGEVTALKMPGLTQISMELLLPAEQYAFAHYANGFLPPQYFLAELARIQSGVAPVRFVCMRADGFGRLLYDTNLSVSLEGYTVLEDAAMGADVTVALTLKQYRPFGLKTVVFSGDAAAVQPKLEDTKTQTPKTYTVVQGDCLWNIAKKHLGSGARYTEIWDLNRDKVTNPNVITPGQVLVMP